MRKLKRKLTEIKRFFEQNIYANLLIFSSVLSYELYKTGSLVWFAISFGVLGFSSWKIHDSQEKLKENNKKLKRKLGEKNDRN